MSLITDALKKAQKLQTQQPEAPASAPMHAAPFPARTTHRDGAGMSFERMLLAAVTLVAVIVGTTAVAILLLRRGENTAIANPPRPAPPAPAVAQARSQATPTAPASHPAAPTAPPAAAAAMMTAPAAAPSPAAVEPVPPPTTTPPGAHPSPAPVAAAVYQPVPAAAAPMIAVDLARAAGPASAAPTEAIPSQAVHTGAPVAAPPRPVAPVRNAGILKYIENARVAGVRVAGDDSRVLMNDHVYRINDVVSTDLGLRLTGVGATALTFVDEHGLVYTKNF